jgi:hypothetical protein
MKVAINTCHGGFDLSPEGLYLYRERLNVPENLPLQGWQIPRDDENLININNELEEVSWGKFSQLKIVEIPDDIEWEIGQYDGIEWVAEKHRKWD